MITDRKRMSVVDNYFQALTKAYTEHSTEHSYRPALQELFSSLNPKLTVVNEPKRVAVGAPDFIFLRDDVPVGYVEAKDLVVDLNKLGDRSKEQKTRYLSGFSNLVYTNGLDFQFFRDGEQHVTISIGSLNGGLVAQQEKFSELEDHLRDFIAQTPKTITTARRLAELMAGKARIIKTTIETALLKDLDDDPNSELTGQYEAFKQVLIHDIKPDEFADVYAETIAYGLFAARLHDQNLDTFSRTEALELLPKSNPFLRRLFNYIAGPDLDDRIAWIIDDLAKIFLACDLASILNDFGKFTGQNDPFLHFYETFLAAYNPKKRKARGVWYTPEPVVNFIVRAVDDVLKNEFGLPEGLADTSKVTVEFPTGQTDAKGKPTKVKRQVHRVQILDPAVGTGTFLAEVIKVIGSRVKAGAPGAWTHYVENELVPRIHGFELLMASYAMCHMKLDMILTEMGYKPSGAPPRLSVYLTNTLEEGEVVQHNLFAKWLATEANAANEIKRDMPIMCVIGNPPYSGHSSNKGDWITSLLEAYKLEPGGKAKLKERNPKWINDDYVKFIRFAEHMIAKNGEGILGFITNHGYLDNPTFRGMRWHLLNTFDAIYVLDLHGNAKKKEVSPDGSVDKNVFDIQQGVAIIIAVKKEAEAGTDKKLAQVFHGDLWGTRSGKYDALREAGVKAKHFEPLSLQAPQYVMTRCDYALEEVYRAGFALDRLMLVNSMGVMTKRDSMTIHFDRDQIETVVSDLLEMNYADIRSKYDQSHDARDWNLVGVKKNITKYGNKNINKIMYRPFDYRYTYYTNFSRGFLAYPVYDVGRHMLKENLCLTTIRKADVIQDYAHAFCLDGIMVHHGISMKEGNYIFPLYLYPDEGSLEQERRVNFDPVIWRKIHELAADDVHGEPDEIATFDYIYGVLHSPDYRETFAEFLKSDFPRIPYPPRPEVFWDVSEKGTELRRLHLMEPGAIGDAPYPFEGDGNSEVVKPEFRRKPDVADMGSVWINPTQRFENVPELAWNFYIGGYQPAQKWLKDRKGRQLSYEDIRHYQRIIKILTETDRIMRGINLPLGLDD